MSWALGLLAWVQFTQGKLDEAEIIAERILREATELGNRWAAAIMRVLLGNVNMWRGEPVVALEYTSDAREMFVELNDAWGELQALGPMILALNACMRSNEAKALVDVMDELGTRVSDTQMRLVPVVLRVAIAVQSGDPTGYEVGRRMAEEHDDTFMAGEQRTLWGFTQLQHGDVAAAVGTLRNALAEAPARGPRAAAAVAYAAALVAAGDADEALAICNEGEDLVVTFVDRYRLELARGFAHHRKGDVAAARQAFDAASAIVEPTHSPLDQFVVRLARAAFESASTGESDAGQLEQRSIGWECAFALMAGTPG
jgi:ATP/maltotriose-dependent transcriptional regulator MalT